MYLLEDTGTICRSNLRESCFFVVILIELRYLIVLNPHCIKVASVCYFAFDLNSSTFVYINIFVLDSTYDSLSSSEVFCLDFALLAISLNLIDFVAIISFLPLLYLTVM